MNNQSKKLDELKKSTDSIFEGVLGYMAGKNPFGRIVDKNWNKQVSTGNLQNGVLFDNDFITVNPDESISFKNGSKIEKVTTGWSSISGLDFNNKKYNWIAHEDTKFEVESATVRNGEISLVRGTWSFGDFAGDTMYGITFKNGFFKGRTFKNGTWKSHATNFIRGTWDVDGSILGHTDIDNMSEKQFKFNLIAVVPGKKIVINTQDGKTNEIHVLKRLDSSDSNFVYKIKFPESKELHQTTISWGFLRGNSPKEFENRTIFSNSRIPTIFSEKFNIEINSPIVKVTIMSSTETDEKIQRPEVEKTEEELAVTQQYYDLSKVAFLGIRELGGKYYDEKGIPRKNIIARVYLHASNNEILKQFENVVKNLDKKVLDSDFNQLRIYLANKIITGAPINYKWLANIIGQGNYEADTIGDKNFIDSLNRIEAFLKYFVAIIVNRASKKDKQMGETNILNTQVQELIKTNIKKYLGIETAPNDSPAETPANKKKTTDATKGMRESKDIKKHIRNILYENLKHF